MKIAVSSERPESDSIMDSRFGRAAWFSIYDTETREFTFIDNASNVTATQGAGIRSAETVVRAGADVVVSGHVGPKAMEVLKAAGTRIFSAESRTVAAAIDDVISGRLTAISE